MVARDLRWHRYWLQGCVSSGRSVDQGVQVKALAGPVVALVDNLMYEASARRGLAVAVGGSYKICRTMPVIPYPPAAAGSHQRPRHQRRAVRLARVCALARSGGDEEASTAGGTPPDVGRLGLDRGGCFADDLIAGNLS